MVAKKNKKGWIKVIEAFISILFLIGIVAIVIQSDNFYADKNPILEKRQAEILNGIQLNETLRTEVLGITDIMNSTNVAFPSILKDYFNDNAINNIGCFFVVCPAQDECSTELVQDEVYVKSVLVTSTLTEYNPKKIKMFCYSEI